MRILLLAAGAAVLLAACGNAAQTATNPQPADRTPPAPITVHQLRLGRAVTLTGADDARHPGRLRIAVRVDRVLATAHGRGAYSVPGRGERFVAVRFVLKNMGTARYDDGPNYGAAVVDAGGHSYDPMDAAITAGPGFGRVVRLRHGQVRAGYIVFAVPKRARIIDVRYALNAGLAPDRAEWRVIAPSPAQAGGREESPTDRTDDGGHHRKVERSGHGVRNAAPVGHDRRR